MYFYKQLQAIKRTIEKDVPLHYYYQDMVEIDNPFHDCKITIPCFIEKIPEKPAFADMKAIAFGLQTLFDAGVQLRPSSVVNGSYLRDVENFLDSVKNKTV